jgi:hypothetical protein
MSEEPEIEYGEGVMMGKDKSVKVKWKEEFNLSDKDSLEDVNGVWRKEEDIKEFLKKLKEEMRNYNTVQQRIRFINKLAGDELI